MKLICKVFYIDKRSNNCMQIFLHMNTFVTPWALIMSKHGKVD